MSIPRVDGILIEKISESAGNRIVRLNDSLFRYKIGHHFLIDFRVTKPDTFLLAFLTFCN